MDTYDSFLIGFAKISFSSVSFASSGSIVGSMNALGESGGVISDSIGTVS